MNTLDFLLKAYEMKELKRTGWVKKVNIAEAETVASHTFGMMLIASLFFDDPELYKLIILHDLPEVIIGDLTPEEKFSGIEKAEYDAFLKLIQNLDEEKRKTFIELFKKSQKNQILKEIDKLDMAIQALYYKNKGYSKEKLKEFIISAQEYIKSPKLRKILEEVKERFEK
jgi:5'-deoxynucleotidase YfbR-like HD superfamily hydrolase